MTLPALPLFMKLAGRPVILLGEGEAADAKRRLLERAGAVIVNEDGDARLAVIALSDEAEAAAAVKRLRARGILVNAVDRPTLCDFTLPAIVDRSPVLVAIGTAGVSAGLAAALRQRIEALLPATLGRLAEALHAARPALRARFPDSGERRRAIGAALAPGGPLDPLVEHGALDPLGAIEAQPGELYRVLLKSGDPEELTLRQARWFANADRIYHDATVPAAILERGRADADRILGTAPADPGTGVSVEVRMG